MSTGAIIIVSLAAIVSLVGWVMLLVAAFRQSFLWGIGTFFLWPVGVAFALMHWREARTAFITYAIGGVALGLTFSLVIEDELNAAMVAAMEEAETMQVEMGQAEMGAHAQNSPTRTADVTGDAAAESRDAASGETKPKAVADNSPRLVRYAYKDVELADIKGKVRDKVQITTRNGQRHTGSLLRATLGRVELRKRMQGGTFDFGLDAGDIERIKLWAPATS